MATSGSNYYSPDGGTLRLVLNWSRIQTDIANNRSKIRLTLQLRHGGTGVWFSARKNGVLHGQSFTYSGGFSNTGTKTLRTRELWVNHNSDGTKSITFNASFNIAITYRGKRLSSMSTSVTANIDRIPRASSINSFSIANHLKPSTGNTVNLSLSRATSSFTHDIELRDGSTVIQSWTGQGTPTTLSLSSSSVDTLLNRMRSVTSRQLTLRVQTKSGSSVIGTTTRNATTYVDSSVKPSVSGLKTSTSTGEKFDWAYVQTHSKLVGSYSSSATGGATIQSESITVKKSDDVMVINGTSGTTSRPFKYDGTYEVIASTTDSRGRTSTTKTEIRVLRYWIPEINAFDVSRKANTPTKVDYKFNVNVAQYARGDYAGVTIERQSNGLAWEEVYSGQIEWMNNDFTGTFTDNSVDTSYSFRITVEDLVGNTTSSTVTISTQRVVLDIHKNEGVGIGKIHEHGVLDVDGEVYLNGKVMALGGLGFEDTRDINEQPQEIPSRSFSFSFKRASTIANPPERANSSYAHILNVAGWNGNEGSGGFPMQMSIGSEGVSLRQGTSPTSWGPWSSLVSVSRGSNSNGYWIRFGDGTQICWHYLRTTSANLPTWNIKAAWTFPISFSGTPIIQTSLSNHENTAALGELEYAQVFASRGTSSSSIRVKPISGRFDDMTEVYVNVLAIGRWK